MSDGGPFGDERLECGARCERVLQRVRCDRRDGRAVAQWGEFAEAVAHRAAQQARARRGHQQRAVQATRSAVHLALAAQTRHAIEYEYSCIKSMNIRYNIIHIGQNVHYFFKMFIGFWIANLMGPGEAVARCLEFEPSAT